MHFEMSSWTDVKNAAPTVVLPPVGSAGQHGSHTPVSADTIIIQELTSEAGQRNDLDSVILPTTPVGIASYHSHLLGALSVSAGTLRQYSYEILIPLLNLSAEVVVFISGHGGDGETP